MTREEAIRWLEDIHRRFNPTGENLENEGGDVHLQALDMAIEALSVDAVEVVRCRDCLMTKERDEYTGKVWCCRHREYMDDMYYCADGLRREDGEA